MAQCFARWRKSRLQTAKWRYISRFATPVLAWTAAQRPVPSATGGKPDAETIPILAMTANAFDDDRQKSLSAGMNDYLPKPLDIPKLTEASPKFRTTPTDSGGLVG